MQWSSNACDTHAKDNSHKKCQYKFRRKLPAESVPYGKTIYKQVRGFLARDSILDSKETFIKCAEEISDKTRARVETSPKKNNNLARHVQKIDVSAPTIQNATKLQHLYSY